MRKKGWMKKGIGNFCSEWLCKDETGKGVDAPVILVGVGSLRTAQSKPILPPDGEAGSRDHFLALATRQDSSGLPSFVVSPKTPRREECCPFSGAVERHMSLAKVRSMVQQ